MTRTYSMLAAAALAAAGFAAHAAPPDPKMSFFVTSSNPGKGADLDGLDGADSYCHALAVAAGAKKRHWRAYLSTTANHGGKIVHARDRIGKGPWYNAKGVLIAKNVDDLHTNDSHLTKETLLTEQGKPVNGRGDKPNMHDILTGSDSHGRAFDGTADTTCSNWTSGTEPGSAQVGHSDRQGLREDVAAKSWNDSHPSRGCSMTALRASGGAGMFYCFSAK